MTVRRLVVCILAVVAIAIVSIYHHALAVKYGYELARLEKQSSELRVSIATLEGRITTLASPARLKIENDKLQLGLVGPSNWQQPPTAVASVDDSRNEFDFARR